MSPPARGPQAAALASRRRLLVPLALCQFVASYAGTNMNVAINSIAKDVGTDVRGVQTAITLFTLTMAALMIPGSKLTDLWGRKLCFRLGLAVYGGGAVVAAVAASLPMLIVGYSLLEGIGSALMIPPIYILVTVSYLETASRAQAFGVVSAAGGIGAAAGPLIGGLVTSAISWRASFGLQVLIVLGILYLSRRIVVPRPEGRVPAFDLGGAVLSAAGLVLVVIGFLGSGTYGWLASRSDLTIGGTVVIPKGGVSPVWIPILAGLVALGWFYVHLAHRQRAGKDPLVATSALRNRTANLGLSTQLAQWLVLQGSFFVISVFLQTIRGYSAVETGLILTPATFGILVSGTQSGRLARRLRQKTIVWGGFLATALGLGLVLLLVRVTSPVVTFVPGVLVYGLGVGAMLTSSVNIVQAAFPDEAQGDISGVSRSASNLGSSLGTSLVGSVLVSDLVVGIAHFALALATMIGVCVLALVAAFLLPAESGITAAAVPASPSSSPSPSPGRPAATA